MDASAAGRGEPQRPPLTRSAPRPQCVPACTRGNDLPGNRHTVGSGHGAPVRSGLLAQAGSNGTGTGRLAEALTRLPTAVATAWRAAGWRDMLSAVRRT